ncbi:hypothetical protein QNM99_29460 [Pseudomonas sp. PCH446]
MNDFSRLHQDSPVLLGNEHWIDGNHETAQPATTPLDQYPDDQRVMRNHILHMDDMAMVERKKLEAPPNTEARPTIWSSPPATAPTTCTCTSPIIRSSISMTSAIT